MTLTQRIFCELRGVTWWIREASSGERETAWSRHVTCPVLDFVASEDVVLYTRALDHCHFVYFWCLHFDDFADVNTFRLIHSVNFDERGKKKKKKSWVCVCGCFCSGKLKSNWLQPITISCNPFPWTNLKSTVDESVCRRLCDVFNLNLFILNKRRDICSSTWLICSCCVIGGLYILTLHASKEHLTNEASLIAL